MRGHFLVDPQDNTLFGIRKKELTPQMVEEATEKGVLFISLGEEYHSDITNQGGCVVWNIDKFEVRVGLLAERSVLVALQRRYKVLSGA